MTEMQSVGVETERQERKNEEPPRRWIIGLTVLFASVGVVWDVLAAVIVFHTYSFFESVVICLLVMILSVLATLRVDFELWSGIFRAKDKPAKRSESEALEEQVRAMMRGLFYAIAFIMALIKLVMTLI